MREIDIELWNMRGVRGEALATFLAGLDGVHAVTRPAEPPRRRVLIWGMDSPADLEPVEACAREYASVIALDLETARAHVWAMRGERDELGVVGLPELASAIREWLDP